MDIEKSINSAIAQYFDAEIISKESYGNGHINDTFCITIKKDNQNIEKFILQKINTNIFKNPKILMENIYNITQFLKKKIEENKGDSEREVLNIIKTKNGDLFFEAENGDFWRAFKFIENTISYDLIEDKNDFYEIALAFGKFQNLLSDFDASILHEIIPNFHNTLDRLEQLKQAILKDEFNRKKDIKKEIDFVFEREKDCAVICDLLKNGEIPLRVTHNDTKINNILLDKTTKKGICVIDLDTVMPGTILNDYGDAIRFGASTALEDEKDLEKVTCSMELFEIYTKGFLEGCNGNLTKKEKELLPMGAKIITLECGIRFLTDYLNGDTYFKIHRENHNLDRARTQFKLVFDMEQKWEQMQQIVAKYF